jgi:Arf-GAP/SH3 domain/ANK repeat/PH domain-containing protein
VLLRGSYVPGKEQFYPAIERALLADHSVGEQDPDSPPNNPPSFLLRLSNEDELQFKFTFVIRQTQRSLNATTTTNGVATTLPETIETVINGLTFAHASNTKELDNLITREFHANPNLQNNANVVHVGNFSTSGSPSVQFDWTWTWKPPKPVEDKGGGWRNCCSFLDYDQRTNRLNTIATFTFWVQNVAKYSALASPWLSPGFELSVPQQRGRRLTSGQSAQSRMSEIEDLAEQGASSPTESGEMWSTAQAPPKSAPAVVPAPAMAPVKVDIVQRPGEDMSAVDDGPLFRATMKALEAKTSNMRIKMKKVLKKRNRYTWRRSLTTTP